MDRHKSLIIKESPFGRGVFSTAIISKGSYLIEMTGPIMELKDVPSLEDRAVLDYYIQCSPTHFLGPSGDLDDIINHSCDPNAGLFFENGKIMIKTIKNIAPGEEIFYDYSTVITNDPFIMKCTCNTALCRGKVDAFKTLPKKIRDQYIKIGMVQPYVIESCNEKRHKKKKYTQLFPIPQPTQTVQV